MIQYTGNPYVDAGVAVLELRLHKPCEEFTEEDLDFQATEIQKEYEKKIWRSYLTVHFMNCAWVQPRIKPENKEKYIEKVLYSRTKTPLSPERGCAFCGRKAQALLDRSHIPLLTSEDAMVAGASGVPGLPACGYCVFAVHFYPLATLKVEGRPLFWWAPDPRWTRRLNACFYRDVQRLLIVSPEEYIKLRWPATHLLRAARTVVDEIEQLPSDERPALCDIVGIHATNYGTDPNFDELRIPRGLLEFWSEAGTWELYRKIEQDAWESEQPKSKKDKRGKGGTVEEVEPQPASPVADLARRNRLYEQLGEAFRSPDYREKAKGVAVQLFLRRQGKNVAPNTTALAEFFLEKVAGMEKERLEAIREMADVVADRLILEGGDRRVAWQLFQRRLRLGEFLQCLSQIQRKLSGLGHPFEWERVLLALALANEEDRTASDHWLVQELMLIRLYEKLATSTLIGELPEPEEPSISQATQ